LEAYDYIISNKSAVLWVTDRYQVKIDKDSGIKNDPNDWAKERDDPSYILNLLLSVYFLRRINRRLKSKGGRLFFYIINGMDFRRLEVRIGVCQYDRRQVS
jgi:hypothetical protein